MVLSTKNHFNIVLQLLSQAPLWSSRKNRSFCVCLIKGPVFIPFVIIDKVWCYINTVPCFKTLNPQRNVHSPYSETVPQNELSEHLWCCDVITIQSPPTPLITANQISQSEERLLNINETETEWPVLSRAPERSDVKL